MARSFKQRGTVVVPLAESPVPMVEVESTDNPASFSETVAGEGNITGLIVYGKSTQVTTTGAQLFDASTVLDNTWIIVGSGETEAANGYWTSDYIPVQPGQYVSILKGSSRNAVYDAEKQFVRYISYSGGIAVTIFEGETYIRITGSNGVPPESLMLNAGSTVKPWEPYTGGKPSPSPEYPQPIVSAGDGGSIGLTVSNGADLSQQLTISTPNGLLGIPVDSGGNYTDADGQRKWVDIIDYNNEKKYQYINEVVVDGTNVKFTSLDGADVQYWNLPRNSAPNIIRSLSNMNNYFPATCFDSNDNFDFAFTTSQDMEPYFETIEELNAFCVQKNTEGNPLTIMYVMDTPIETPLSEEEIAAYRALHTYDGTTVISVNSDTITPGVKTTVKIIDPNSDNPQVMRLWLDEEGQPANINGRGARVGGAPTQQYILQPCSF